MVNASTTSPFAITEDVPWILWQQQTSVNALQEEKQTDGRSVFEEKSTVTQDCFPQRQPVIQRMQYNAVLNRINQAARRTGNFSAWNGIT